MSDASRPPATPTAPVLAVVGHPNKGKSSLVASLAQDDSVGIGADPGTTMRARAYPMRIDGELLYSLIDTPGFQRARQVLGWLRARAEAESASAADRARLVREFVSTPEHELRFPDECELLRPIVSGAGILYVVDGSVPYGPEYEAEMEILRWTGAPSMAIINPIERDTHVEQWQAALTQFFRVVRVVDAVAADFETRRRLLAAFAEIEASWRRPIEIALEAIDGRRVAQRRAAAREIAEFISTSLTLTVDRRVESEEAASAYRDELEGEYKASLAGLEAAHRRAVQRIYEHFELEASANVLEMLEGDLFSERTWLTFGLRRRDLVAAGAASGAATGGVIDVALGGASVLLGVAAGAAIGGVLGWLGAGRLAEMRVIDRPLGGTLAQFGPSKNPNFPFVLLGRARVHYRVIERRTHAMRTPIDLGDAEGSAIAPLEAEERNELEKEFKAIRKTGLSVGRRVEATDRLRERIVQVLEADEGRLGSGS